MPAGRPNAMLALNATFTVSFNIHLSCNLVTNRGVMLGVFDRIVKGLNSFLLKAEVGQARLGNQHSSGQLQTRKVSEMFPWDF